MFFARAEVVNIDIFGGASFETFVAYTADGDGGVGVLVGGEELLDRKSVV